MALLDLEKEMEEMGLHVVQIGVVVSREISIGSTLGHPIEYLPLWKRLIDDHRHFHHEMTVR